MVATDHDTQKSIFHKGKIYNKMFYVVKISIEIIHVVTFHLTCKNEHVVYNNNLVQDMCANLVVLLRPMLFFSNFIADF